MGVIGCGKMGRFHAKVFGAMPQVRLVGVCDANPDAAAAAADAADTKAFTSIDELLAEAAAVTVAVPTVAHPDVAERCMAAGVACLIEKPLAKDSVDARRLCAAAAEANVTVQVGHIERFNPAVRAMRQMDIKADVHRGHPHLPAHVPQHRRRRRAGHDDPRHRYRAAAGRPKSEVTRIDATGVSVTGDAEDICNARLTFANGCVANITASRLALKTERKLRVFSNDAYVSVDYQKRYGIVAHRSGNVDAIRDAVAKIRSGEIQDLSDLNFADLVKVTELQIDDADPLRAELESFVNAVRNRTAPEVPAEGRLGGRRAGRAHRRGPSRSSGWCEPQPPRTPVGAPPHSFGSGRS